MIFDISRFCLNDGPGIRTTVFLKGCPLNCVWCHNPESQTTHPEILFSSKRCIDCGLCVNVCPTGCHKIKDTHIFDRNSCIGCGLCTKMCPTNSLRLVGTLTSAEEVMQEILKDKVYYKESGGGLTLSGGEPMMQPEFLEKILHFAKQEGLHTCIETCGYAKTDAFKKILPLTDYFLFDWKESNPEKHREFTGKDNALILKNLEFLDSENAEIILRIPLIPGYNDSTEHMNGIVALSKKYKNIKKIEIMPYHPLGTSKAEELGREKNMNSPTIPDKTLLEKYLEELRLKVNVDVEICI